MGEVAAFEELIGSHGGLEGFRRSRSSCIRRNGRSPRTCRSGRPRSTATSEVGSSPSGSSSAGRSRTCPPPSQWSPRRRSSRRTEGARKPRPPGVTRRDLSRFCPRRHHVRGSIAPLWSPGGFRSTSTRRSSPRPSSGLRRSRSRRRSRHCSHRPRPSHRSSRRPATARRRSSGGARRPISARTHGSRSTGAMTIRWSSCAGSPSRSTGSSRWRRRSSRVSLVRAPRLDPPAAAGQRDRRPQTTVRACPR